MLRTEADRTAFESEGGLRVTVDERVRMSGVAQRGWLFPSDDDDDGGDGNGKERRLLLPFTVVEVKIAR